MYNENIDLPIRETEIGRVMSRLNCVVENLENDIDETENRISPILNLGTPTKLMENAVNTEFSSKLAQEIVKTVYRLEKLGLKITDMRNRIEL